MKLKKLKNLSDVKKADLHELPSANAALRKLRSYLDTTEPELVYFLQNLWKNQGKAITYKEMREAILNGDLDPEWIGQWQQDYSRFISDRLEPKWLDAMAVANTEREEKYPDWYFNPASDGVRDWTRSHSAELVTQITAAQVEGLRAVIRQATVAEVMTVDVLSRAIRSTVGLTKPQAVANLNYYNKLIENGLKQEKALDLSARYAARQHRWRAYMIARTEICMAYNHGAVQGIKQAQAKGYMGEMVKIARTALDERSCSRCTEYEGKEFAIDNESINIPFHPACRCTWEFKEISKPK